MEDRNRILWPGWETIRLIGRGSFGAVYEIERRLFEDEEPEKAALKVISIPQNDSDIEEMYSDGYDEESVTSTLHTHLKSIVAEYSLMRKMNGSSNIVNCDDVRYVQHDDGIGWDIYIKMELLTPLAKALPATVSEVQVMKIARDMCAALELCSKHNIIHRDIKPQNIFVSENDDYKLGDFGIAKTVEKTMGGTKTGTYKYMAPEVYSNRPYNSTADIYSLGLVLYWLLNERRMPFMPLPPEKLKAGMDEESRNRRFSGEPIPAPANGSGELKRIVLKACAFDPKDRYQSATELLSDLNALGGVPAAVVLPVKNKVEEKSIPDVGSAKEEATLGPVLSEASVDEDVEATVGPAFNSVVVEKSEGQEKIVGPLFVPKEIPKQPKKKKKLWPIIVASVLIVVVMILFWPVYGKWSEWSTDIPTSEDIKLESRAEYRYRCKELVETQEELSGLSGAELVGQQESWSEYGQWGNWQEKRIEADDNCDVESATRYRSRKILVEKEYSEWSEWSNWGNQKITKSDLTDVQSRTVYEYNVYRYYVVNTGASIHRCGGLLLAHCRKFGGHTEEQINILREILAGQRPESDLPAAGVVYQSTVLTSVDTHAYVDTSTDPYVISSGGSKWYTNSAEPSGSYKQYRSCTRTLKEKTSYSDWSDYTDEVLKADEDTDIESCVMYRCRTREKIITYQYRVWGDWSDWQKDAIPEQEDTETEQRTLYRYAEKHFLWEKLFGLLD